MTKILLFIAVDCEVTLHGSFNDKTPHYENFFFMTSSSGKISNVKPNESGDWILSVKEKVLSRKNPDKSVVVMLLDQDEYFFILDRVAAEFFGLIDGKKSVRRIQALLEKKHARKPGDLNQEVSKLVKGLLSEKVVGHRAHS